MPDAREPVQFSLLHDHDQASFIGDNPVRAEAGIATILLKTNLLLPVKNLTIIASSPALKQQETRFVVDVIHKRTERAYRCAVLLV